MQAIGAIHGAASGSGPAALEEAHEVLIDLLAEVSPDSEESDVIRRACRNLKFATANENIKGIKALNRLSSDLMKAAEILGRISNAASN